MKTVLKTLLINNAPIKLTSIIFGYTFWCIFSASHTASQRLNIPLCFYNLSDSDIIEAPEKLSITISGKRTDLWNLDSKKLAAHIDMQGKKLGHHPITITAADLFLPETIKLVHYSPSNATINLTNKKENQNNMTT